MRHLWVLSLTCAVAVGYGGSSLAGAQQTAAADAAKSQADRSAAQQLLVVRSASWGAATARLTLFEKHDGGDWKSLGGPIAVNVGRRGMAWGRGLHAAGEGPLKKEGDGKSPAGVFSLGTAFGSSPTLPDGASGFAYLQARDSTFCVEDVRSPHYNQIVDGEHVSRTSWERWSPMKRSDGLFDWGVVVHHNEASPQKGAGSCVFMHKWRGPGQGTSGCTAMAEEDIVTVLRWLDQKRSPLLVQVPDHAYPEISEKWGLPALHD